MTVAELIKQLKQYPLDAQVAWQDHDSNGDRINAIVRAVFDFDEENSFDPEYCKGVKVVLRP